MKLIQRLAGNTAYLFLDWLSVTILSFLFWMLIWKTLPPESSGMIATSVNLIILISTFSTFGMHGALNKLVSEMSAKKKGDMITALIKFSNRMLLFINLVVSSVFLFSVFYLGIDIKIPAEAALIVGIGIVIWPIANSTTAILLGLQNMKRIYITDTISNLIKLVVAGVSIFLGYGYLGPLSGVLIAFIAAIVLRADLLRIGVKTKAFVDKSIVVRKYALSSFIASSSWAVFFNTPTIILAFLDSFKSSGIFSAALSIANPIAYLPNIVSLALFPIASALSTSKKTVRKQAELFSIVIRYMFFLSLPVMIVFFFFSKPVVIALARLEYLDAVQFIPVMGLGVFMQAIGSVLLSNLYAIGRPDLTRNISVLATVFFLLLSVPATYSYGLNGLVASYIASVSLIAILGYIALKRSIGFYIPWISIGKVLLASAVMIIVTGTPHAIGFKTLESIPFLLLGLAAYIWMLSKSRFFTHDDLSIAKIAESKAGNLNRLIRPFREFLERVSK
jgi:O-antigen/teichoic acid export membrane protein